MNLYVDDKNVSLFWLYILFCFFLLIECNLYALTIQKSQHNQGLKIMNIVTRNIKFKVPDGFHDIKNYSFKTKQERELLTISYDHIEQTRHLDELYKEKRENRLMHSVIR
jgi:hypothetical protein